ncbi:hypothetical protein GGS21DRAFT_516599 [Xylaria nigripes]|nr:hypothetical protein GGS21DRAFT_516599 [Xylaria nigripes]
MLALSPPAGDAGRVSLLLTTWVCLSAATAAQTLPYIPTSIFLPMTKPGQTEDNDTGSIAYIFSPHGDTVDLLTLDTSATLTASSLSFKTLSSNLPFLESSSTAFVPSLADNGSLIVYAGDCSTSSGSGIWSLNPGAGSTQWTQEDIKPSSDGTWIRMGPSFLGHGFSFSAILEPESSPVSTFVYGGMCPNNSIADPTSPQSDATYSNQMVKISQSTTGSGEYTIKPVESDGPPIPEAGFTFTGLAPSFSNRSDALTQQRDYVLLGGHTQYAFINMSTVAIWSLPQETWSFISDIGMAGSGSVSAEMAAEKTAQNIDSRSGHSAVLNEDGTALIILGGWVGDPTQAAIPQLAVLQIGWDHGGNGEWQWSIPNIQPQSDAIYGHGATLLPGNVMMVYGGYSIHSSGNHTKREASSNEASFLNITSMTWSDTYTNPSHKDSTGGSDSGQNISQKQKLSLGLGLGLGLGLTMIPLVACMLHRRRNRKRSRDVAIRALSQDTSLFIGNDELTGDYDGDSHWYSGSPDPYVRGGRSLGYQSLQTGRASMENSRQNWFGDMIRAPPPMLQINKNSGTPHSGSRGAYQPASSAAYDPVSSPRGLGGMNPIFEADEDDTGDIGEEAMSPVHDGRRDSGAYSDPFGTPTQERPVSFPPASHSSQTPNREERNRGPATDPEVQDWMTDMDAADALLSGRSTVPRTTAAMGRSSSRRGQNTSAEEEGMGIESNNVEVNNSNLSRSGSILRQLRTGLNDAAAAVVAATTENRGGSSASSSAPSYNTARTGFLALQAEGPALLLGRRDGEREYADDALDPGSPSKNKPLRRSWLGSLRRVFTGPNPSSSSSGLSGEDGQFQDGVVEANDFEARPGGLGGIGGIAADVLSRRKSGRKAWESQEAGPSQAAIRYAPLDRENADGEPSDEEEWDIEKAVEKRLVQFMFTVPKEPLRVVNAEPDFVSERDVMLVDAERGEEQGKHGKQPQTPKERSVSPRKGSRQLESPLRLTLTPSPTSDDDDRVTPGSHEGIIRPSREELRRELQREWERIEAEEAIIQTGNEVPEPLRLRTPPQAHHATFAPQRSETSPRLSPLLHPRARSPRTSVSGASSGPTSLTLEEQINLLGTELHQARSAAQTPMSQISHHSDADVLSAQVVRFERPSGSTSTLQIPSSLTSARTLRIAAKPRSTGSDDTKPIDLQSESNLHGTKELESSISEEKKPADIGSGNNVGSARDSVSDEPKPVDLRSESNLRAAKELRSSISEDRKPFDFRSEVNLRAVKEWRNSISDEKKPFDFRSEVNLRATRGSVSDDPKPADLRSESNSRGVREWRNSISDEKKPVDFRGENNLRAARSSVSDDRKSMDLRSESNLRGAKELRGSGNNTPNRRVRAMVEEFESKSSLEGSPAGIPGRNTPTRRGSTPGRGSPTKGA